MELFGYQRIGPSALVMLVASFLLVVWMAGAAAVRYAARRRARRRPIVQFRLSTLLIGCIFAQIVFAVVYWLAFTVDDHNYGPFEILLAMFFALCAVFMGWAAIGDRRSSLARRLARSKGVVVEPPVDEPVCEEAAAYSNAAPPVKGSNEEKKPKAWWRRRFAAARPILSPWSLIQNPPKD